VPSPNWLALLERLMEEKDDEEVDTNLMDGVEAAEGVQARSDLPR
jgi:hypothetical protein